MIRADDSYETMKITNLDYSKMTKSGKTCDFTFNQPNVQSVVVLFSEVLGSPIQYNSPSYMLAADGFQKNASYI